MNTLSVVVALTLALCTNAFTPSTNSRWMTHRRVLRAGDFVDPFDSAPDNMRTPENFGDPFNSYWGIKAFEKQYGTTPKLGEDVYEVLLPKPLGIVFEEIQPMLPKGVRVAELVEGGNAEKAETPIKEGDVLVGVTGVKVVGAKYERQIIPA